MMRIERWKLAAFVGAVLGLLAPCGVNSTYRFQSFCVPDWSRR